MSFESCFCGALLLSLLVCGVFSVLVVLCCDRCACVEVVFPSEFVLVVGYVGFLDGYDVRVVFVEPLFE